MRETAGLLGGVFGRSRCSCVRGCARWIAAEIEVRMRRAGNEGSPRVRGFNQEFFMGLAIAGGAATAPSYFDGPVTGRGSPRPRRWERPPTSSPRRPGPARLHGHPGRIRHRHDPHGGLRPARPGTRARLPRRPCHPGRARGRAVPGRDPSRLFAPPASAPTRPGWAIDSWVRRAPRPASSATGLGSSSTRSRARARLRRAAPPRPDPRHRAQVRLPGQGAVGIENTWAVGERCGERITELPDDLISSVAEPARGVLPGVAI